MITRLGLITLMCLSSLNVGAETVSVGGCGQAAVQGAIDASSNGDTVLLQAGCSATWTSTVNIPGSKYLTLDGNKSEITRGITGGSALIALSTSPNGTSRITNFTFKFQSGTGYGPMYISVGGGWSDAKFRIDNNTFNSAGTRTHLTVWDAIGVIDSNVFHTTSGGEIIHVEAYGNGNTAGWSYDVAPGSGDAVYIEDNRFYNAVSGNPAYFYGGSAVQNYYGARTVFRHNFCQMCQFDAHGTAGMVGARWWEVYENEFNFVPNANQDKVLALRAGSGVVFDNMTSGSANSGSGGIVLYEEDSGYPALYQVGRGKDQIANPAYIWNNASTIRASSGSANVQVNRDFILGARPGYTPYTYPHPVRGAAIARPEPPSDVRVTE